MKTLNCLTKDCINLLQKNNLLKTLIKAEFVNEILSNVPIDETIQIKLTNNLKEKLSLNTPEKYQAWLNQNKIDEKEFSNLSSADSRLKIFCKEKYKHKAETKFLERKNSLDIVVYSLIRVKDIFQAKELYLRIVEGEADFGDLAATYSEGIEKKTRGLIGPISLNQAHPQLAEILRNIEPGKVQPPTQVSGSNLIVRLESYDPAQLDDFMRGKMEEELFNDYVQNKVIEIEKELVSNLYTDSQKGDLS